MSYWSSLAIVGRLVHQLDPESGALEQERHDSGDLLVRAASDRGLGDVQLQQGVRPLVQLQIIPQPALQGDALVVMEREIRGGGHPAQQLSPLWIGEPGQRDLALGEDPSGALVVLAAPGTVRRGDSSLQEPVGLRPRGDGRVDREEQEQDREKGAAHGERLPRGIRGDRNLRAQSYQEV